MQILQVSTINMSASVYLQYCFLGITILSSEHKYILFFKVIQELYGLVVEHYELIKLL